MPATKRTTRRNASARVGRKRVSRALTKYVRNFTGTITRTGDGQVVIAGTGPKPKTAANPTRRNVEMGFRDQSGIFHPIRGSNDYSQARAGEGAWKKPKPKAKARKTTKRKTAKRKR